LLGDPLVCDNVTVTFGLRTWTMLAASSWPFGVLLAVLVFAVPFVLAYKSAGNSRQRVANLLFGALGSIAACFAVIYLPEMPQYRWIEDYLGVVVPAAMSVGGAMGVALSLLIRTLWSFRARQQLPCDESSSGRSQQG
jgi:hypothetical protein